MGGVSIYPPGPETPARLHALGVAEVKFNIEAATPRTLRKMCPGLSWEGIRESLSASVALFGRGRVYSNVIVGLGETDDDLERVMEDLAAIGVIPVLRPLTPPAAALADRPRPPAAERLLALFEIQGGSFTGPGSTPPAGR
ncbi:radical SAM protein [Methanoculleus chikugoensis]|uniref:radical SAM protein n=1 Tax=Methanoculleus chikugoensis TaxID=118126 RepID=UPI001FB4637B|nr:radical SAM protein [Methanoculleus chikugoensis]